MTAMVRGTFVSASSQSNSDSADPGGQFSDVLLIPMQIVSGSPTGGTQRGLKITLGGSEGGVIDADNTVKTQKFNETTQAWDDQTTYSSAQNIITVAVAAGQKWRLALVKQQAMKTLGYRLSMEWFNSSAAAETVALSEEADAAPAPETSASPAPKSVAELIAGSEGEAAETPAAEAPTDGREPWMPAKYWDAEKRELRVQELAKGHAELEKRFGKGSDLPPKSADEYKLETREGESLDVDPEGVKQFAEMALATGVNNVQFNELIRYHMEAVDAAFEARADAQRADTAEKLLTYYGSEQAVLEGARQARKAIERFGKPGDLANLAGLPNSDIVFRVLDAAGQALKEDHEPGGLSSPFDSLEAEARRLYKDKAGPYWNDEHPDHEAAKLKITRYENEKVARRKRAGA